MKTTEDLINILDKQDAELETLHDTLEGILMKIREARTNTYLVESNETSILDDLIDANLDDAEKGLENALDNLWDTTRLLQSICGDFCRSYYLSEKTRIRHQAALKQEKENE